MNNQSAFPFVAGNQSNPDDRAFSEGMTLRQWYAGLAFTGGVGKGMKPEIAARIAFEFADAMIKESEKQIQ